MDKVKLHKSEREMQNACSPIPVAFTRRAIPSYPCSSFSFFRFSLCASVANSSVAVLCRRQPFVQQRFDCCFPTGAIARANNLLTNAPFAIDYVSRWQHRLRESYLSVAAADQDFVFKLLHRLD